MKTTISTLALCVALLPFGAMAETQELNALVWCDHTDDALIKPFEEKFDVKVNLKEYEGTGAGAVDHRAVAARRLGRAGDRRHRRAARGRDGHSGAAAGGSIAL